MKKLKYLMILILTFNSKKNFAQVDYATFKCEKVQLIIPTRLNEPFFDDYQRNYGRQMILFLNSDSLNRSTDIEKSIALFEMKKYKTNSKMFVEFINKLTFTYGNIETTIVKYLIKDDKELITTNCSIFQNNGNWELVEIKELENIFYTIKVLKKDIFWEFYNRNKRNILEIDNIKGSFQNNGVLNLDKLGKYLRTKPKEMEKYCDF